ncbi:hypothetical protein EKO04_010351 [Ascochyta lentis]|uniref:Peptidase M12A domain-containing protein n=1 Tax=Ascochyta lentis TaxID=205686 RepID=A0A8H7IY31_9PLEO|nr:hypothetical protein EKO04_010351 [Ascochyta lentis]
MLYALFLLLGLLPLWPFVVAKEICAVSPDTIMVHDALSEQTQYGSASELKAGLAQPWPLITVGDRRLRVVKYCYATKIYRDYLHCQFVMPAFTVWSNKLGYPASAQTGHSLGWEEAKDGNEGAKKRKRQYCYNNYKHGDDVGTWNPLVDADTLVIALDPTITGGRAKVGYNALSNEPGRHQLVLGVDTDVEAIAHELGHVFGMVHEQHRNDRDEHVLYECKNVQGYNTALAKAMVEGLSEAEAHTKLCEDRTFAVKHDFFGSEFTKNPAGKIHDEPGGFDLDSIMLYPSYGFANPSCDADKTKCPLLKLVKANGQVVGTERIPENTVPSDGDITWLKTWYPWE